MSNRSKSRKRTPWDGMTDLTPIQEFLKMHYTERYEQRHPKLDETGEAVLINSFKPSKCPYCEGIDFIRKGRDANGVMRYRCSCGRTFNTLFDSRKIAISEWIEYCLNIFLQIHGTTAMQYLPQSTGLRSCSLRYKARRTALCCLAQSGLTKLTTRY